MKKLIFAMFALGLVMVSCKSSSGTVKGKDKMENVNRRPMGVWKAMEWSSSDKIETGNGVVKVEVPAAKNMVELDCTNYNRFWLSSVNGKGVATAQKESYKGEFFEISCIGNKLMVSFDANSSAERSVVIDIQSGDIFSKITLTQKAE